MTTLICQACDSTWNPDDTTSPGEPDICVACWDTDVRREDHDTEYVRDWVRGVA